MKKMNYYATEKKIVSKATGEEYVLLIEAENLAKAMNVAAIVSNETGKSVFAMRRAGAMDLTAYGKVAVVKRAYTWAVLFSFFENGEWAIASSAKIEIGKGY